jgi:signal transduction histidine kinase
VLLNLISNSAKFTSSDGIIKITANTNTKGELLLEVSDTGVGMSEDEVKTSLTTFGQVHKDIANRGTGIGLPLSKMLVELHDGKFIIQSSKNIGTKVTILVPAYRILWSQVKPSGVIHS